MLLRTDAFTKRPLQAMAMSGAVSAGSKLSAAQHPMASLIERLRRNVLNSPMPGERLHAVFLNERRVLVGNAHIANGASASVALRMRDLFAGALAVDASEMVLAHNHPSGDCRPSAADIEATNRMTEVARSLDIALLDHLIFTDTAVYSMRAGGQL